MDHVAYEYMADNEKAHWWFLGRRKFIQSQLERFKAPNLNVLEVGCGTGGNIETLLSVGNFTAIEMNSYARQVAEERYDVEIVSGSMPDDHPFKEKSFDLIFMLDVLEHIEDDVEVLKELKTLLKPQGKIIITVPAYQFLWSEHDKVHHHYKRYSRKEIRQSAGLAKLNIKRISNFNFFLLPLAIIDRLVSKVIKSKKPLGEDTKLSLLNGVFKQVFSFETKINNGKGWPLGLSLYAELSA